MVRLSLLPALAVLGCGRVDFEELRVSDGGVPRCAINDVVDDPLSVSGKTFRYTSFDNNISPVSGVAVTAGPVGATTPAISGADGTYQENLTTGGVPIDARMVATLAGNYTTWIHSDLPLDRPISGPPGAAFAYGDVPIWDAGSMTSIYNTAGESLDAMRGTLNVAVRDCDGNAIAGAVVTFTPPPRRQFYQNAVGTAINTAATELPFTHAIALGAVPGTTHVSTIAPGFVFPETDVDVMAGTNNTILVVHGAPVP